jgi:ubiquinone/menaquinone biosynthesis C-methylase UbiE
MSNPAPSHPPHEHGHEHSHEHGHEHGDEHQEHGHGHAHLDEEQWARWAANTEVEGEVFLGFVTIAADKFAPLFRGGGPKRIFDIGAGPAVASCEFSRIFPHAQVVAFDSSPAMLATAARRIEALGVGARVSTAIAEMSDGLAGIEPADLIWASMSLHHVGDEVAALRKMSDALADNGVLVIVEMAGPTFVLPTDSDAATALFVDRLHDAWQVWFNEMRHGLPSSVASKDLAEMITSAGFDIVDDQIETIRFDPPLTNQVRNFAVGLLERTRHHLATQVEASDLATLDALLDDQNPDAIQHRGDAYVETSRRMVIAKRA